MILRVKKVSICKKKKKKKKQRACALILNHAFVPAHSATKNVRKLFAIHPEWFRSFGYHMTFGDLSHLSLGFAKKVDCCSVLPVSLPVQQCFLPTD